MEVVMLMFSIPIVAIVMGVGHGIMRSLLEHRVKMAEVRASFTKGDASAQQEIERMRRDLSDLRDRMNQLAIDNDRLTALITHSALQTTAIQPPPPPEEALRQRLN
jgi:hypothetical protein